jgi:hypothetical protein
MADNCFSKKQWVSKLGEWNLKKNVSSEEMANIVRIQQKRKVENEKETHFLVRGRTVAQENIDRWQKRQKTGPHEANMPACSQNGKYFFGPGIVYSVFVR